MTIRSAAPSFATHPAYNDAVTRLRTRGPVATCPLCGNSDHLLGRIRVNDVATMQDVPLAAHGPIVPAKRHNVRLAIEAVRCASCAAEYPVQAYEHPLQFLLNQGILLPTGR